MYFSPVREWPRSQLKCCPFIAELPRSSSSRECRTDTPSPGRIARPPRHAAIPAADAAGIYKTGGQNAIWLASVGAYGGGFAGRAYATIPVGPDRRAAAIARRGGCDQQVLPPAQLVHRRRAAGGAAERQLPDLLAGGAVVDVDLAIGGGDEHQSGRGRDDPALDRRRRARPRDPLTDQPQIVAEADLPLDRALVEIVGGQRRVGRIDDGRVEPEAFGDVAPFLSRPPAARRAPAASRPASAAG